MTGDFISRKPKVTLESVSSRPFDMAAGSAKQCYSSFDLTMDKIPDGTSEADEETMKKIEGNRKLVKDIAKSGHHTTLQHQHYTFHLGNISRHFTWSFLHSHPFYNSEQQSQRYVEMKALKKNATREDLDKANFVIPPLEGASLEIYVNCVNRQFNDYNLLRNELLREVVEHNFYVNFPSRRNVTNDQKAKLYKSTIDKKCQELARYVLPVATFTKMYHTVSLVSLLRYHRMSDTFDVPHEQKLVVSKMIDLAVKNDPQLESIVEDPLSLEETPEYKLVESLNETFTSKNNKAFREEFDKKLDGKISKLVDWQVNGQHTLADSISTVLGISKNVLKKKLAEVYCLSSCSSISDQLYLPFVIGFAMDPSKNEIFGERFNQTTMSKLTRALYNVSYTFMKKISHTGDSQDQRHRMTPASRPTIHAYLTDEPDFIYPMLLENAGAIANSNDKLLETQEKTKEFYERSMEQTWHDINKLKNLGVSDEYISYLLPNAVSLRFYEAVPLMGFHHKAKMRLCLNAQEEIFRATVQEVAQIAEVHPFIGRYFGAPCHMRDAAGVKPPCPEGGRYCGIPVWNSKATEVESLRLL